MSASREGFPNNSAGAAVAVVLWLSIWGYFWPLACRNWPRFVDIVLSKLEWWFPGLF